MGGEFSTDFKSSNRIELYQLVQLLLNFTDSEGAPLGGGGGWMDLGGSWDGYVGGVQCTHACTHTHTCMHACTCMFNMINMDASMLAAICNFYTCMHMCMHACAHVW